MNNKNIEKKKKISTRKGGAIAPIAPPWIRHWEVVMKSS